MEDNKNNENQVNEYIDELKDKQQNVKTDNETTENKPPEYLQGYKNLYTDDYQFADVYVPTPENKNEKHKKHRGISVAIISILIIFSLALGSLIGFGGAMLTYGQMAGEQNTDTTTPLSTVKTNGSELPITYSEQDIMNRSLTIPQAASLVKDSVVEISTETRVMSNNGYTINSGAGSGVIIDGNGYIVTNNHVIEGAGTITVKLTNGNSYVATLIGTDEASDIALISIKPKEELTVATLGDSDKIVLGETVIAVGNPLGELGGTITDGIISATERRVIIDDNEMTLIQTNAAVSPGNSGGGLFNMAGELIGIVNAKSVGEYAEGLAFAIPVNKAEKIITALDEYGYVKGQVDTNLGLSLWESPYGGVYVQKNNGNFVENDIIVTVDDIEVSSTSNIKSVLRGKKVGDTVKVTVSRGGRNNRKLFTYPVTLTEYVPSTVGLQ